MEYRFKNGFEYLKFRDAFYDYMDGKSDPFRNYVKNKMDYKTALASMYIGKAHYDQFIAKISQLEFTPQAKEEMGDADTVIRELNYVIIREDIETGSWDYPYKTEREAQRHISLFPSSYHREAECFISLPERYELLLDRILSFHDAVLRFDIKEMVEFLCARYQGLDASWAEERLTFLSQYYQAQEHLEKQQRDLLRYREEAK